MTKHCALLGETQVEQWSAENMRKLAGSSNHDAASAPHLRHSPETPESPFPSDFHSASTTLNSRFLSGLGRCSWRINGVVSFLSSFLNLPVITLCPWIVLEATPLSPAYLSSVARMSTGVDSQQSSKLDLNLVVRQRSVSRGFASVSPHSVESGRVSDKASDRMVSQSQKSRWLKTGAIVSVVFMILLWLSPSQPSVPSFTQGMHQRIE